MSSVCFGVTSFKVHIIWVHLVALKKSEAAEILIEIGPLCIPLICVSVACVAMHSGFSNHLELHGAISVVIQEACA